MPFFITAAVYVAGGIFTLLVDPTKPLWPHDAPAPAAAVLPGPPAPAGHHV